MTIVFTIPVNVVSEANARDCRFVVSRRAKNQKKWTRVAMLEKIVPAAERYTITLTRIMGKRQRPFDGDNLQRAFKAVRDGVAKHIGIDDGSNRLEWRYGQEKGVDGKAAVMVEIKTA